MVPRADDPQATGRGHVREHHSRGGQGSLVLEAPQAEFGESLGRR